MRGVTFLHKLANFTGWIRSKQWEIYGKIWQKQSRTYKKNCFYFVDL
jgi:hypothetical protein